MHEEGYVTCDSFELIGAIQVSHEHNPLFDENVKYPMIGYQLFYRARVKECLPFKREQECTTRIWVEPEEIAYALDDHELTPLIVMEAVKDQQAVWRTAGDV